MKLAKVSPVFKKNDDLDQENYRPVMCQRSLKRSCTIKYIIPLSTNSQIYWLVLERIIAPGVA